MSNPFGSTPSTLSSSAPNFGSQQTTQTAPTSPFGQQRPLFGQGAGGFGTAQSGNVFGQTSQQASQSSLRPVFGQSPTASTHNQQPPAYGHSTGSAGLFQNVGGQGGGQSGSASLFPRSGSSLTSSASSPLFGRVTAASTGVASISQGTTGFGQPAAHSTVSSSAFGQTGSQLFGQSAGQSFGQTSRQPSSSSFSSGSTPSLFSGTSTTTAVNVIGSQSVASSSFGASSTLQSPFSRTSNASTPNLFVKSTSTATTQFGTSSSLQPSSVNSSAGGSASLFGKTAVSSGTIFSGPASQAPTSAFGKASPILFGKGQQPQATPTSASPFSQSSSLASENAFAKSTGFSPSAGSTEKLFGTGGISAQGTGQFGSTAGLFGKKDAPASAFSATGSDKTSTALFGKVKTEGALKSEPSKEAFGLLHFAGKPSGGFGVKSDASSSGALKVESSSSLFGAKSENVQASGGFKTEGQTVLFGGRKSETGASTTGGSAGLFGKGTEKREDRSQSSSQGTGLFGKPAGADSETDRPESSHGPSSRGLFGKQENNERSERVLFGKRTLTSARRHSRSEDREQGPGLRRQMSEELGNKVAIVCRNLPPRVNNTNILRSHFRRFGEVTKVFPNPAKGQATVHFKTHEAATEAKRRGRQLGKDGPLMTIFWSSYSGPGTPRQGAGREADRQPSRPVKRTSDVSADPSSKRISWKANPELDDELQSMSGTHDMYRGRQSSPQPGTSRGSHSPIPSPEKRNRSASPAPVDVKGDKITMGMFEGVVARTTTERVDLLNLRDKYIRQYRKKKDTDISTAKAFLGTCLDMCPEKERYDREDKRRLSVYEVLAGSENMPGRNPPVDHSRAVKEYIRSSPDQDEPLPHELRPLEVLLNTMTFLLSDVANQGQDGHWADWFDYLWNRTRGIRKDITQQQLCSRGTVSLIERCARFHIFCSERLCEEDMHAFDEKINNENLTKCLQTLKEFYADLEKKKNCFCPSEPEFRAYMVLMNLNEGDILRQVQQLRPDVRTHPHTKFALQAYFALSSNNYIRFFRLVKNASFAQACIMHRYFTQVRNKALLTMMRGYGMGNRPAQIPLGNLVQLLAFENENEAQEFCEYYGFNVVDGEALLDKAEYIEPEAVWPAHRSVSLIESKLLVSIGEMINGEAFTSTDNPVPSSSFDRDDRFHSVVPLPARRVEAARETQRVPVSVKQEPAVSWNQEAKMAPPTVVNQEPALPGVVKHEPAPPAPQQPQDTAPQKPHYPNEIVKDSAKLLFWEVINEMVMDISMEAMTDVNFWLKFASDYTEVITQVVLIDEVKNICEEVVTTEKENREKALQQEREERKDRVAQELTDELTRAVVAQEALNLATIEIREVKAILKKQCIERVTDDINKDLVEEVFKDMVKEVSDDVFETDVTKRLEELEQYANVVKLSRAGRFLSRWKKNYNAVRKLKRAMQEFPSSANMEDAAGQVRRLIHVDDTRIIDKQFFVNKRAKLTIESPMDVSARAQRIETQFTVHALYQKLLHHTAWQPLDLSRVVGKILARRLPGARPAGYEPGPSPSAAPVYWKLLLCLPETDDDTDDIENTATCRLCQWLTAKLSKGKTPPAGQNNKSKVISLYKSKLPSDTQSSTNQPSNLGVCVRTVSGTLDYDDMSEAEEERVLLGTSGLIFVLPVGAPVHDPKTPYWREHKVRLQRILEVKPMYQLLPLVIVVPLSANQMESCQEVTRCMAVADLTRKGLVCDCEVVALQMDDQHIEGINVVDPEKSEMLCKSLQWLAESTRAPPTVAVSYLRDTLEKFLLEHYYTPTQQNLKKRKLLGYLDQDPNSLLNLYNSVMIHIVSTITADDLSAVSWPVPEFVTSSSDIPPAHWNSEDHFEYLYNTMGAMTLPEFFPLNADSEEWADVKRDMWQYVSMVTGRAYGPPRTALYSRLKKLLKEIEQNFEETCYLQEGEDNCEPTYINVPWSRFISLCIDYRFNTTDFLDPVLSTSESDQGALELRVAYDDDQLNSFCPPEGWRHIESEKSILETPTFEATIQRAVIRAQEKKYPDPPPPTEVSIVADPNNISQVSMDTSQASSSLIRSLQSERRRSDHFQKYLENALKSGEEGDSSFNNNATGFDSVFHHDRNMDFSVADNTRRLSFDATGYFHQSSNDISRIFDNTITQDPFVESTNRRASDVCRYSSSCSELSGLYGKKRKERLSEIFGDDPVALSLKQPTLVEDFDDFKESLKSSRRESDLFEKRLQSLLTNTPVDNF